MSSPLTRSCCPSLLVLTMLMPVASSALTLVENGQAKATIVISADVAATPAMPTDSRTKPSPEEALRIKCADKVKVAANDLQAYLEKISGAKLPIVTDKDKPQGTLVLVGKSALTDALKAPIPSGLTNARREEGFLILCRRDRLVLAGNDAGPYHGTEYAVYEFLNRLGVRWFMPSEYGEVVPKQETITVADMQVVEKPDFVERQWWLHITKDLKDQEIRWKLRNKMNPDEMFAVPGDGSVRRVIPEKLYFAEHPEYFALKENGKRDPYLPKLVSPEATKIAADIIKEFLRNNPLANSFGFAPDDGSPQDFDPDTMKLNQGFYGPYGRMGVPSDLSGTEEWFYFVNNVTREVRKEFPDVYIASNGYSNRNNPPEGMELDDHLVIMFAAIWSCTLHAYDDPHCWQMVRQGQMLKRWCELCKNVWIYGYNYKMLVSGLTPLPEVRKLRRDFPLMKKWGVMGFRDENRNVWAEAGILSRYLRARLEWDADLDVDALVKDFYTKWYGKAAAPMQAFYDAIEDCIEKSPMHGHEDRIMPEVYTPALLVTLKQHLTEAQRVVDAEPYITHVAADAVIYDHLKAYMDMSAAEAEGNWQEAAKQAARMLELRRPLHDTNPFYIWFDENGYHTGVWYWKITKRQAWYQSLADMTSGKTGDLVALLPATATFRTDFYDEGVAGQWHKPDAKLEGWRPIRVNRTFYSQGYMNPQGYPYIGYMWYRWNVNVPQAFAGRKIMLYAPVVETEGWCWVNGKYIGHRPYKEAYIRPLQMELDVTNAIQPGQINTIAIRVNTSLSLAQAAGGLVGRVFLYAPKEAAPQTP